MTYDLWQGFVQTWEQSYDLSDNALFCRVAAVDSLGFFSKLLLPSDYFAEVAGGDGADYWYRFAEQLGTVAADELGNLNANYSDSVETRSTGSLVEGLNTDSAIDFGGSLRVALSLSATKIECLEMLIQVKEYPADFGFLFDSPPNRRYAYIDTNGYLVVKWEDSTAITSSTKFRTDIPYHVTFGIYADEATGVGSGLVGIFVNGILEASTTAVVGTGLVTSEAAGPQVIGSHLSTLSYYFNGVIDEALLYISYGPKPSELLEHYDALFQPLAGQLSGERIDTVLDLVNWPAGDRDISPGQQTIRPANFDITALNYCQKIAQAEQGQFFAAANGDLVFRDSSYRTITTASNTSQATFGDSGAELRYSDIKFDYSNKHMVNTVRVSRVGGTTYTARNQASVDAYGERSRDITDLEITDDNVVRGIADWMVEFNKDPQTRVTELTFQPRRSPSTLMPQALGRDIGHRITANRRPGGVGSAISKELFIEGIGHRISKTDSEWDWKTTWNLSPAQDLSDYWILGTSTFDTETVLSYP